MDFILQLFRSKKPLEKRINIEEPRYDQEIYWNRVKHFYITTNPLNLLCTKEELNKAQDIVTRYRNGEDIPGLTESELWRQKYIYDSAFHPDSGEKMFILGRMSAQVPMGMLICGNMLTFYKNRVAVVFWQWFNQSFNALVNYSNRSGSKPISTNQLATSYVLATGGALTTALGLNHLVKGASPLLGRFVPFFAVAAANCINIPLMRSRELKEGVEILDKEGNNLGTSKIAAKIAISQVLLSRIVMASPGFIFPALLINVLENRGILGKKGFLITGAIQVTVCGICIFFATPMCCALFPQKSKIHIAKLEQELQKTIRARYTDADVPKFLYYNKGL